MVLDGGTMYGVGDGVEYVFEDALEDVAEDEVMDGLEGGGFDDPDPGPGQVGAK